MSELSRLQTDDQTNLPVDLRDLHWANVEQSGSWPIKQEVEGESNESEAKWAKQETTEKVNDKK